MAMNRVAVVGLGKLGLPIACCFANSGNRVLGIDKDPNLLSVIESYQDPHDEAGLKPAIELAKMRGMVVSDNLLDALSSEFIIIIVPTPSGPDGAFDNSYVKAVLTELGPLTDEHIVVISSTVMPGSCEKEFKPLVGDASLIYSPEFVALGSVLRDFRAPDMVLIGGDKDPAERYEELLRTVVGDAVPSFPMTLTEAEITKLSLNTYLDLKLAYTYVISRLTLLYGGNPRVITKAIGTDSRVGRKFFDPGLPPGGTCLPRDLDAFITALGYDPVAKLGHAIREANENNLADHLAFIRSYMTTYDKVAILGLSYKVGTPVTERSFGFGLAAHVYSTYINEVYCYDPKARGPIGCNNTSTAQEAVDKADLVVICTQEKEFETVDLKGKKTVDIWGIRKKAPNIFCLMDPEP